MLDRVVKSERLIAVLSAMGRGPDERHGGGHHAVPNSERNQGFLFFSKCQCAFGKIATYVGVRCEYVRHPEAMKHQEQQQRVFRRFPERYSLLNKQTCLLQSCSGFWSESSHVVERT